MNLKKTAVETNVGFNARSGTFCGTVMVILLQVQSSELLKTILLASIGAVVSFIISHLLKWLVKAYKRKKS